MHSARWRSWAPSGAVALKATLAWLPAVLLGGVSLLAARRYLHDHPVHLHHADHVAAGHV